MFKKLISKLKGNICEPYCTLCGGCGEEGCCSHINCFRVLVEKAKKCEYGKIYLKEAIFNKTFIDNLHSELFDKIDNNEIKDIKEIKKVVNDIFDKTYDDIY